MTSSMAVAGAACTTSAASVTASAPSHRTHRIVLLVVCTFCSPSLILAQTGGS
jgi:hypothetical protein